MRARLLALVLGLTLAGCGSTPPPALPTTAPSRTASVPASPAAAALIEVYVTGAVEHPGVYSLPPNSRIQDAITAAGGFVAGADMPRVNLAARVRDEDEIFVPKVGEAAPSLATKSLNVNTASATQLRDALGIPSTLASRIVSYRRQHGPFRAVEDLRAVPVPDDQLARIRSQITTG